MQNITQADGGYMLDITVNKMFTTCGKGLWSNTAKEVFVESINMFISTVNEFADYDDTDEICYCDGDLQAYFTEETWDTDTLGLIYTDKEFLACVHTALIKAGISIEAAEDVSYSEQGMQGDNYVSMDAYEVGHYIRARMLVTA